MSAASRRWLLSCLSTHPFMHLSTRPSSQPPSQPGTHYISRHPNLPVVQSHKLSSTRVTTDAYMMLQNQLHFQTLHPKYVPHICLLSVPHATTARERPLFSLLRATSAQEMKKRIVFSPPAGRRILYCQITVMIITRVSNIFGRESLFIWTLRISYEKHLEMRDWSHFLNPTVLLEIPNCNFNSSMNCKTSNRILWNIFSRCPLTFGKFNVRESTELDTCC
jgi:hypothetical protein